MTYVVQVVWGERGHVSRFERSFENREEAEAFAAEHRHGYEWSEAAVHAAE